MDENVFFKSSTRSPIYVDNKACDYPIKDKLSYTKDNNVKKYIYNIKESQADEVFMFFESKPSDRLIKELSIEFENKGIKYLKLVTL